MLIINYNRVYNVKIKMRQFFKAKYTNRRSVILLNYNTNYQKYTFLQSDLNNLQAIQPLKNLIQTPFISMFQKYKSNILQLSNFDVQYFHLNNLNSNKVTRRYQSFSQNSWIENFQIIKKLAQSHQLLAQQLFQKINEDNLSHYLQIIATFNCIGIRLWQKIYSIVSCKYKNQPLQTRNLWNIACQQYSNKFFYKRQKFPMFKFMYPEVYLNDVTTFRDFFKIVEFDKDYVVQKDSYQNTQTKLQILNSRLKLIVKTGKAVDLNMYFLKERFQKRTNQMIQIAKNHNDSILHEMLLIRLYHFYSYINYEDFQFFKQIQKYVIEYLGKKYKDGQKKAKKSQYFQSDSQQSLSKMVVKILSIWKLNQFPNVQIYEKFIKPYLIQMYLNNQNVQHYEQFAANLLASGIGQMSMIKKLLDKGIKTPKQNESSEQHILKHYMNIYLKQNLYQTGNDCIKNQNKVLLKHLDMHGNPQQIRSSCLNIQNITTQQNRYKIHNQIQHAQIIWFKVLDELFKGYKTYKNQNFCEFQIDYMVFVDTKIIIFEIIGGHYTKKIFNQINNYQEIKTTGKKRVRQTILNHYGLNIIQIHVQESNINLVQQTKNIKIGKKILLQKINKIIPQFRIKSQL